MGEDIVTKKKKKEKRKLSILEVPWSNVKKESVTMLIDKE